MTQAVDLFAIGGGINGASIARDATGRGLSVVLCEKDDLARCASSHSGKLVHGGLRYLEYYEFRLVSEAPIEREVLLNAASHIVSPMLFGLYQTKPTGGRLSGLVVRRMTKRSPIHFFKISSEIIRLPVMMYVRLGLASSVFWRTVVL